MTSLSNEQRVFSHASLKALSTLEGLRCGPLSPLARVPAPSAPADAATLVAAMEALDGDWQFSIPALVDPGLTLGILVADREGQLLGQYVWPDHLGASPGFKVSFEDRSLVLSGPLSLPEVQLSLVDQLVPSATRDVSAERFALNADQFWTLLAMADAFGVAAAQRLAARAPGMPVGVTVAEITASWQLGLARPNPNWAVSLATMLAPDALPKDFPAVLSRALKQMQDANLLSLLAANTDDPAGEMVLLANGIDLLCRSIWLREISFGLVRSETSGTNEIEVSQIVGWRNAGGFVLADLSGLSADRAELVLIGGSDVEQLIGDLLGTREPPQGAVPHAATISNAELIKRLRARKSQKARPEESAGKYCPGCGAPLRTGARFCGQCGQPLG